MTEVRIHSLVLSPSADGYEPWTAFEWNDSGDDTALVDWAEAFRPGQLSASVDAGDFNWEQTANGSDTGSVTLASGVIIRLWKIPNSLGEPVHVDHFDEMPPGRWFSDEFGRPFDVNDLQAP